MTLIRKLVSVACLALSLISYSASTNAQTAGTIDPTTGNLITGTWSGTTPASGYNGFSGGYEPGYISNQKSIVFGYAEGTASQSIGIASALAAAGTGIEVKGYNYSWYYYNNDYNRGSLTGNISLKSATGAVLESYNYNMPQLGIGNWIQQSGHQAFTNPYQIGQLSTLDVSFTGKDDRWWAGYYGPAIKAINVNLSYGVNPCATNPAYSPNCAGFDKVLTSSNLVPYPNGYAVYGDSINQSYAINTALASAGSAAQIHGFQWGYVANANGPYCAFSIIICFDERIPKVQTNVNITNSSGASLYSVSRNYENSYNTTNYSYLFPSSQTMSTLGNFNFTATTYDSAYVGSMWSRALYTVDPCAANPLYSPTCSGYGAAFAKTLSTSTTGTSTATAYTGVSSTTTSSQVETTPTGTVDQTNPQGTTTTASTSPTSTTTSSSSTSSSSTATATQDPAQPTATAQADVAQPASTTPTPAGGPPATTTASSSSSSTSSSSQSSSKAGPSALAMSVVNQAKDREAATQKMAVQNAAKSLENSTQQSQASSNMAISMVQDMSANSATAAAQFSNQTTQASVQASQVQQTQQMSSQTISSQVRTVQTTQQQTQVNLQQQTVDTGANTSAILKGPNQLNVDLTTQASAGTGISIRTNTFGFSAYNPINSMSIQTGPAPSTTYQFKSDPKQFEVEAPTQVASFSGVGKAGNPLSEMMMQQRFELMQTNIEQRQGTVNKNVQPNDLAGGVDIASMALIPAGFSAYSFTIRDAAFYEPKEIYKNQTVVDNARALRQMSSDSLHKQMVDSQYNRGN